MIHKYSPTLIKDLCGKVSLVCNRYITNFDPEWDWEIESVLHQNLLINRDELVKLSDLQIKTEIEKIIVKTIYPDKDILEFNAPFEERFLENADNESIVRDTLLSQTFYRDVDIIKLRRCLDDCILSLDTIDDKNSNSYLLSPIDLELYNTLLKHPDLLKQLNWRVFEKLIADILESFNYEVELMQGTKDNGIDVIAVKKIDTFGIHRYLIQAKRWNNKVGIEPVERLLFKQNDLRATKSCLVTTSQFTKGAWALANKYKYSLDLKDFDRFQLWLKDASILKSRFNVF